jgi:RecB family exonuclease
VPLELVTGLSRDRSAEELRRAVARAVAKGRSALMGVPVDADAVSMRERLSGTAPVGVRVATLDGVVESEWALLGDGRRIASGLARDVLLARALVSAGVSEHPGSGAIAMLGMLASRAPEVQLRRAADHDLPGRIVEALAMYRQSLSEHGLIERAAACARLAEALPPAEVIAVEGFIELAPELGALLAGWSASGADVHVSLPWRRESPGTAATTATVDRMIAAGATVRSAEASEAARPAELDRIRRELFAGRRPGPGAGAVALAVADGEEAEARHIARAVAGLIEAGARTGGIVIAFADPARHDAWLRRALRDEGVEARIDMGVGIGETAFGRALLALRACSLGRSTGPETVEFVRSPFSGERADRVDSVIAKWRRAGTGNVRDLLRAAPGLNAIATGAEALRDSAIAAGEARKWKNLADRLLANAYQGVAPVPTGMAAVDASVHRAFCALLHQALELGEGEVTAEEFWERFGVARVGTPGARQPDAVLVTSVDTLPSAGCDHLVLGGLTASEFPRKGSEDRLEGDAIVRAMADLGIDVEEERRERAERRSFFLAVTSPRESLALVRRGADDEGAPLRESMFWDEFLDLYRSPGDPLPDGGPPRIEHVGRAGGRRSGARRAMRGCVSGEDARMALAGIGEVSPSEIETYLACPYRWFIDREVGAKAPEVEVGVALAGQLAHAALARFYREWLARGNARVTAVSLSEAVTLAAECAREMSESAACVERLEERLLIEGIEPMVIALVERDATFLPGFAPVRIEWEFGRSGETPAFDLGDVRLTGRADRIDVGPDGLVVVDYKRSHASSLAEIHRDRLVQLPLYAAAASDALGLPVAGGLYRGLKEGSDRGFVLPVVSGPFKSADVVDRDAIDELLAETVNLALRAVSGMREGSIGPTPCPAACRYCRAAGFCGEAVRS